MTTFPKIVLNSITIEHLDKVRNLGAVFNKPFSWADHTNVVMERAYGILRILWKSRITPLLTQKELVVSLVIPYILYFICVWHPPDSIV